jgi:hypothetical protein
MKVAIVFIGTSKYLDFLPQYYEKIHDNFLPNTQKTFLVFTDGEGNFPDDIKVYHQEHLKWPYITLHRFKIINNAREEILKHDWLIFLDADTLVVDKVFEYQFFTDKPLFGVWHPGHYMQLYPHNQFPGSFETNIKSLAYVDVEKVCPPIYYQGCLWGGKIPEVLDMIDELENNVDKDLENNVIAVWHDESHLNRYFIEHSEKVNTLGSEYAYPEAFDSCNFEPKIMHLAKDNSKYHQ